MIAAAIIGWEMQRMMMVFRDNFSLGAGIQFFDFAANRPENGLVMLCSSAYAGGSQTAPTLGHPTGRRKTGNAFRQRYPKKVTA